MAPTDSNSKTDRETVDATDMSRPPNVQINRRAFRQESFNTEYRATKPVRPSPQNRIKKAVSSKLSPKRLCATAISFFPVISWVRNYNLRQDILADIICGVTIAIFQVPQAMAYAQLSNVEPVYGLYSSFFPVLIYFFLGTSRQLAMGTFAVGSLMMGAINARWIPHHGNNLQVNITLSELEAKGYTSIDVASTVALWCGIFQLLFWLFRLGALSVYLSDHLVSGFTCASALHIATSQMKTMFGVPIVSPSGTLGLIYTYVNLFEKIHLTNVPTISLTICSIVILVVFKEFINPRLSKVFPIPFPIELGLVVAGTIVSSYLELTNYKVSIVGHIGTGIPTPKSAPTELLGPLAVDSLVLCIVLFSQTLSLGKIFAKKHGYEIEPNQECLALGVSNVVGSFFFCVPTGGSLSRSSVQDGVGGRTQLVSGISCIGILVVLLALGPLLEDLPNCVLSAIIVVSLKHMLGQVFDLPKYWKLSKIDGLTWLISFLAVFILDVDIGLGIGVGFSLGTLILRSQIPNTYLMGVVEYTDVYVPLKRYLVAKEIPGFKIFRFDGPLHFGNVEYFTKELAHAIKEKKQSKKPNHISNQDENGFPRIPNGNRTSDVVIPITDIILDCSAISFVDTSGVRVLRETYEEYEKQGIMITLACCASSLYTMLKKDGFFDIAPTTSVFPTIQDAILFQQKVQKKTIPNISSLLSIHIAEENSNITKL